MDSTNFTSGKTGLPKAKRLPRTRIALVCLVTYFLVWVAGIQGVPLFLVLTMARSHQMFLSESQPHAHMTFHYSKEKSDGAMPADHPGAHSHPETDHLFFDDTHGETSHHDHEIHLLDDMELISAATQTMPILKTIFELGLSQRQTTLPKVVLSPFLPPPLQKNPTLLSIRTIVLLI